MLQSLYNTLAVLSRGNASRADLACLVHTVIKDVASCSCLLPPSWVPAASPNIVSAWLRAC